MLEDTLARRVRSLAEAFAASDLVRLSVSAAEFDCEVRRAARAAPAAAVAVAPAATVTPIEARADTVTSDIVGVVRLSRPQVHAGQQLDGDRELAFVEALGIRNPVRSRGPGRVAAIFVSDGQPVEFGQPLFAIER